MEGTAVFSPCRRYRYLLTRRWSEGPVVLWIMLNPSTADAERNDPTIRRCIGFSQRWGFGAMHAVNLFALRSTDPTALLRARDPVGPETDVSIRRAAEAAAEIIAAWGAFPLAADRGAEVLDLLGTALGRRVRALGETSAGHPRHPLYLRAAASRRPYRGVARPRRRFLMDSGNSACSRSVKNRGEVQCATLAPLLRPVPP